MPFGPCREQLSKLLSEVVRTAQAGCQQWSDGGKLTASSVAINILVVAGPSPSLLTEMNLRHA